MWNFLFYEKRQIKFYVRIRVPYEMLKNFLKYFKLVKKDEKSIPNVYVVYLCIIKSTATAAKNNYCVNKDFTVLCHIFKCSLDR